MKINKEMKLICAIIIVMPVLEKINISALKKLGTLTLMNIEITVSLVRIPIKYKE